MGVLELNLTLNPPYSNNIFNFRDQTSCANTNDGSSTISVTGGLAPYNLSWTGPSTDNPAGDEIAVDGGSLHYSIGAWKLFSYNN